MSKFFHTLFFFAFLLVGQAQEKQSRNTDFNFNWKFSLVNDETAFNEEYNDTTWRTVNLPHDWSVEFAFDTINAEGCTAYLPGGVGWYRKTFSLETQEEELIQLYFDGVYNNSEVWLNGNKLGNHPYGYTPFHYDLTPYLKEENVLAVKVDRTHFADSRWYSGSGIYRDVQLIRTKKIHVPIWGTFVTTPEVTEKKALVRIETKVANQTNNKKAITVRTKLMNPQGEEISSLTEEVNLETQETTAVVQEVKVKNPLLWDIETPNRYKFITEIVVEGKVMDTYNTNFGIRSIRFDAKEGFFLNGNSRKIKGVCLHHDAGIVGAAVPKEVWKRRLEILKMGGCNAIRISHNPASEVILEVCDELGLLVQDEFFDEWDYPKDKRLNMNQSISTDYITQGYENHFQKWAEKDLKTTMLAHRNHPSIIQWSIGNEIEWTYPRNKKATGFWDADWSGNYFWNPTPLTPSEIKKRYNEMEAKAHTVGETAQKLAKWTKELDTSRPVIANCILPSASYVTGYADALDMIGFSYRRVMYDYGHKYFPNKPIMGTENVAQWHEWKAILERPYVAGTYLWTGTDYMGEAHHRKRFNQRSRGTQSGLLDFAGFAKPSYYMMKSLWNEEEATLYMSTQLLDKSIYKLNNEGNVVEKEKGKWEKALWVWHNVNTHWNYNEGENVVVEIISNCPEVELFLNGKSLGKKALADFEDHLYKWNVPYKAGKLEAKAIYNKKETSTLLHSANTPTTVRITPDKTLLSADGYDVSHVLLELVDDKGNPVMHTDKEITVRVNGTVTSLGVDNGNGFSLQPYKSNKIETYNGKALLLVQSTKETGKATIKASLRDSATCQVELKTE